MQYSKKEILTAVLKFLDDRVNQMAFLLLTILLLYGVVYRHNYSVFKPKEKQAHLHEFSPEHIQKFAPSHIVKTGFILKDILSFEPEKRKILFDGMLWFDFDHKVVSLEDIDKCSFGRGCTIKSSLKLVDKMGERTRARYYVQVEQIAPLNFANFPVDDHRLDINIVNKSLSADRVLFIGDASTIKVEDGVEFGLWKKAGSTVRCGYRSEFLEGTSEVKTFSHNQIVFSIDLDKESMYNANRVILPVFLILLLVIFAMLIPFSMSEVYSYGFSFLGFIALLIHRSVIFPLLPTTAYYSTGDKLYFFALIVTFIICLKQLYLFRYHNNPELIPVLNLTAKQVCVITYWFGLFATIIMTLSMFS